MIPSPFLAFVRDTDNPRLFCVRDYKTNIKFNQKPINPLAQKTQSMVIVAKKIDDDIVEGGNPMDDDIVESSPYMGGGSDYYNATTSNLPQTSTPSYTQGSYQPQTSYFIIFLINFEIYFFIKI